MPANRETHAASTLRWIEYSRLAERGATSCFTPSDGTIVIRAPCFHPAKLPTVPKAAADFDQCENQKISAKTNTDASTISQAVS